MVEASQLPEGTIRLPAELLREFTSTAFSAVGVPQLDADLVADVLVSADLRGIRSHGVARIEFFLVRIERGLINTRPQMTYRAGTDTTGLLEADGGIGIVAAERAMTEAIVMAERHGAGFVAVTNSSHFGYAGYWSMLAMEQGCIGIAMSNSGRRAAPTFGSESLLGTNPISVALSGGAGRTPFVLDMATTAVAVGKIETALREDRPITEGWLLDQEEPPHLDERGILSFDTPLLPLGGAGDNTGGHKGYGLALLVELLCGALAGEDLSAPIAGASADDVSAMGHFMGAIRVSGFRSEELVHTDMEASFDILRRGKKERGRDRVFIHGEPESAAEQANLKDGIPITPAVRRRLQHIDHHLGLGFEL